MGAIRAIRFSSDGQYMANLWTLFTYSTRKQVMNRARKLTCLEKITGISFSPDIEALFVGISDRTYGSVLELIEDTITDTWSCCFSQPNRVGPP
ncbi:hypothetical protein Hanom_Chr08g00718021 [Helianthus anomalus]